MKFIKIYQDKVRKFAPQAFGLIHYENPAETMIINDFTALSCRRSGCLARLPARLATHSFSLFFERNELIEVP